MLQVFQVNGDFDFACAYLMDKTLTRLNQLTGWSVGYGTRPLAGVWEHDTVLAPDYGDRGARVNFGDFFWMQAMFGVREPVGADVHAVLSPYGEFLPCRIKRRSESCVAFNVLNRKPILDHERSVITGAPKRHVYAFNANALTAGELVRDSEASSRVFTIEDGVANGLKRLVEEKALTGLAFRLVWEGPGGR